MLDYEIKAKNVDGHYEIYVDGEFECSCDVGELTETLDKVEKSLKNFQKPIYFLRKHVII